VETVDYALPETFPRQVKACVDTCFAFDLWCPFISYTAIRLLSHPTNRQCV